MKPLNFFEIQNIGSELEKWIGARLQNVFLSGPYYIFEFYVSGTVEYLGLSLNPLTPHLIRMAAPPSKSTKTTPAVLFLKSHVVGKKLASVEVSSELGRILVLNFGPAEDSLRLEIRLFPHGQNLIVTSVSKKISAHKVKDLPKPVQFEKQNVRSWSEIAAEVTATRPPKKDPAESHIQKKEKILQKMIEGLSENLWQQAGEYIKTHQTLQVPSHLQKFIQPSKTLSENIEICFQKSKQAQQKHKGTLERIEILKSEIKKLAEGDASEPNVGPPLLKGFKGQRIPLENGTTAWIGKSARDNLQILRLAKAWDFWLHLKDFPGAYGIIRRNKTQSVSDGDLVKISKLLAERSKVPPGQPFEVIVAECRFVKPLKGDRLGRATYSHERTLRIKL